jgi:formate dehydrogenase subunit gamma
MHWTSGDSRWLRHAKAYVTNKEALAPEDTGFFNGGQKLYFWTIAGCAVFFLLTGILMWFDDVVNRWVVAVSYVVHDLAALAMLAGFIIHIYEGTAAQPGTFQAMTNGTVTKEWAWTHHPAWYADVTGRDPREDYELELQRLADREASESEGTTRTNGPQNLPS